MHMLSGQYIHFGKAQGCLTAEKLTVLSLLDICATGMLNNCKVSSTVTMQYIASTIMITMAFSASVIATRYRQSVIET